MIPAMRMLALLLSALVFGLGTGASAQVRLLARGEVTADAVFGGISGIDRDRRGRWYLVSDDRSERAPARFYTARISRTGSLLRIRGRKSRIILDSGGQGWPKGSVDIEAIRDDPARGLLIWSSEGDPAKGIDPMIRRMDRKGRDHGAITLPPAFAFDPAGGRGPRNNNVFEGLSFAADGALWVALEAPLIEDGPVAGVDRGATTRFSLFDRADRLARQYAYPIDPVRFARPGRFSDNGVSEILAVDDRRLLVLERAGEQQDDGRFVFHCRLYLADLAGASDVSRIAALRPDNHMPIRKHLLFDFDTVAGTAGNLEGMAWGRDEADGPTLMLVSDNNFAPGEPTRFMLLGLGDVLMTTMGSE